MRSIINCMGIASLIFVTSCAQKQHDITIEIENNLPLERSFETVELTKDLLGVADLSILGVRDPETSELLITQLVDNDNDGSMDVLLFQPVVAANTKKNYQVVEISNENRPKSEAICYSRFVPERTDDYAWENDKVAFRTYGPNAQYRFENNLKEGTLSSGVDAWLKRVEYSIIDNWYKKYTEKTGTYHEDTGEGLDNFHVGSSRGVGGIATKKDSIYYFSKNFINWKTITTGPIRTSFTLEYAPWDAGGTMVKDIKTISLDRGNNLSKFEIYIEGIDTISAGLTLHEKDGLVTTNQGETWIDYWQPHDDSQLGTAIVSAPDYYAGYEKYDTDKKDLSNAYVHLNVKNNKVIYYAGFTWQKSGQFKSQSYWEQYLSDFAKKIRNPLKVSIPLKKTFQE